MEGPVHIGFRGLEPREDLRRSAQGWTDAIDERLPRGALLAARVDVYQCGPEWGGSTTVRVELTVEDEQLTEFVRHQNPREALQRAFASIATRLRPSTFAGSTAVGAWS